MKKVLLVLAALFIILLGTAFVLPIIFKDDIRAAIDEQIASSVNAQVYFDPEKFDLTLFKNFPNLTVSLGDFGVIGKDEFKGKVLMGVKSFSVVVDLYSLIYGDQPRIKAIDLEDLVVNVKVLKDGTANYDIAIPSEEEPEPEPEVEEEQPAEFSIAIDSWSLTNANIIYDDRSLGVYTEIKGLNHSGSGDFSQDIFDLNFNTHIDAFTLVYAGDTYMNKKQIDIDITFNMDLLESKYTFKENTIKINDFAFSFDGFVLMPGDDIEMDITYGTQENTFRSVLSLVPGVFTEGFEDLKTSGNFEFNGMVKGIYSEANNTLPAFNLTFKVDDAMFQYPDLPTAINNINLDVFVDNKDGVIENTIVDVRSFHMDMGSNPIDAKILIKDLEKYTMDANIKAELNLAELASMFPMEGLEMRGTYNIDLTARGYYDSIAELIPTIDLKMALKDGNIKYAEYPIPMEKIRFTCSIVNSTGKMDETVIKVDDFNMLVDGEKFGANMVIRDLSNYQWDVHVHGGFDLEKITKIYPLEGMTLKGKIKADLDTKGRMSDLEKERYHKLPTSGSMSIKDFEFVSEDLPQGFSISSSKLVFTPGKIQLNSFNAKLGRSDLSLTGKINNYIGYAFKDKTLKGEFNFRSKKFDLNEWMVEEEGAVAVSEEEATEADSVQLEVVEIPKNIDFVLKSRMDRIIYDNMNINDLKGDIIVRNGQVKMRNIKFNTLKGQFTVSGTYDTRDIDHPKFDFAFAIKDLAIRKAYKTFNTVQTMAPIAQNVKGNFSTDFKIKGELEPDMMPDYNTLVGAGLVEIAQATLSGSKVISRISKISSIAGFGSSSKGADGKDEVKIKDVKMQVEIKNGRMYVEPFDVELGGYKSNVSGSNGIDGSLDYVMKMEVPAGALGEAAGSALASLTGTKVDVPSTIILNIGIGGTYEDPQPTLLGTDAGTGTATDAAKDAIVKKAKEKATEEASKQILKKTGIDLGGGKGDAKKKARAQGQKKKKEAEAKAKKKGQQKKKEAEAKAKKEQEKAKKQAEEKAKKEKEKLEKEAKDKLKKLFGGGN